VVSFSIVGDNPANGVIKSTSTGAEFSASQIGQVTISGKIGDTLSGNAITIFCLNSDQTIGENLQAVFDSVSGAVFGQKYDIGISKEDASSYEFSGAEGILKIDDDGQVEVCGFGYGKCQLKKGSEIAFDNYYNIYNSILCTKIKEDLISQGVIANKASPVTNDMLTHVISLDLAGELINDPTSSFGIKYLTSLKKLNLSKNEISDLSFLSSIRTLVEVDLSHNNIGNIDYIVDNQGLEKLNLAYNFVSDVKKLQYVHFIEYLDLSYNGITNINPLSSVYSLKSLLLNGNTLKGFYDPLSGLENLTELGIGYCGINFSDIKSLPFLKNLTYLDISGTNPSLANIATLAKLKSLILSNCNLSNDDISVLNVLTDLEMIDISDNGFDAEKYGTGLDGTKLTKLVSLSMGGMSFTEIPNLSSFKALKALDLTNSYNLISVSALKDSSLTSLVLDDCNSLDGSKFMDEISQITTLTKLSIVSGFSYLTSESYGWLIARVDSGSLELRLYGDEYCNANTISNYTKSVFFSMDDFIKHCAYDANKKTYLAPYLGGNREIVLSLANDTTSDLSLFHLIEIPKTIFKFTLVGKIHKNYYVGFSVQDRNESSMTFDFTNVCDGINGHGPVIHSPDGSKTIVNYSGINRFSSNNKYGTIETYDLTIAPKCKDAGSSLEIVNTSIGQQGKSGDQWAGDGEKGAPGIYCNNGIFSGNLSVKGGQGGQGGYGVGTFHNFGDCSGHGGNGGRGGAAISYGASFSADDNKVKLIGGAGGAGGGAQSWALAEVFYGKPGSVGPAAEKH